jgi:heptosyltransferase-2/heptosyltransferase-3
MAEKRNAARLSSRSTSRLEGLPGSAGRNSTVEQTSQALNARPLVVHFGAMGDMVMLTAVTRLLADRFAAPCDVVASHGSPQLVFRELDSVGDIFTVQSRRRSYWLCADQRELVRQLRSRGPSPTFVLDDLPKVLWLMRRAGIPDSLLVWPGQPGGPESRRDLEHLIDFAARLVSSGELGPTGRLPDAPTPVPELRTTEAERRDCRQWLAQRGLSPDRLVLWQPLSRRVRRGRWPVEHWRRLAAAIYNERPDAHLLLTGSPEEAPLLAALEREMNLPQVQSVEMELPLRRLFALLELAHSFVSIDTGPAQAAAALGCPLVVLIGQADPRRCAPRGHGPLAICTAWPPEQWPQSRQAWESEHHLAEIEPDVVIEAWLDISRQRTRIVEGPTAAT